MSTTETATDGLRSWHTAYRDPSTPVTSQTQTAYNTPSAGYRTVTTTAPDSSSTATAYYQGRLNSVTRKNSSGGQVTKSTYGYDTHGRQSTVTDARNGTTTTWIYNVQRGWLDKKVYQGETDTTVDYEYKQSDRFMVYPPPYALTGRLQLRQWWRGRPQIATTNAYNSSHPAPRPAAVGLRPGFVIRPESVWPFVGWSLLRRCRREPHEFSAEHGGT